MASTGVIRPLIRAVLGIVASGRGWFVAAFWAVSRDTGNCDAGVTTRNMATDKPTLMIAVKSTIPRTTERPRP